MKTTKKDYLSILNQLTNFAKDNNVELPEDVTYEDVTNFIAREQELLENKAASAAKRAATKKTEGDALRQKIFDVLTDEFQNLNDITVALGDTEISAQMVAPRLKQLVDLGEVVKEQQNIPGTDGGKARRLMGYKRA